jgi:protein gp37
MARKSNIEWTDMTWNPVTGCTKVSSGCKHCYAELMAKRLKAMGSPRYENGFRVTLHYDLLELPKTWRAPRMVFVNSMSDLFHPEVSAEFIQRVFETMASCPQHQFQVLTKRPGRVVELQSSLEWPDNVWMGVSIESQAVAFRSELLQQVPAKVRFISAEPLIGPIQALPLENIHWVIVGGESGPKARPMLKEWVLDIREQCQVHGTAFFFKQWGGVQNHRFGRELEGRLDDEMPRQHDAWKTEHRDLLIQIRFQF